MKQLYFFVTHDENNVYFDSGERLLQFLKDNTSEDELVDVGTKELTKEEFDSLDGDCETPGLSAPAS